MRLAMKCSPWKEICTSNSARSVRVSFADVHDRVSASAADKVDRVTTTPCTAARANREKSGKCAKTCESIFFRGATIQSAKDWKECAC